MRLYLGIDLGQAGDHSAIAAVEKVKLAEPILRQRHRYVVRLLNELPLGIEYPEQVRQLVETLSHPAIRGGACGVDYTGVGRPVFDYLKAARPPVLLYPVLTTSGNKTTFDLEKREIHVPKLDQVSLLQTLMQADLINWHKALPTAERLREQLRKYQVKITKAKNQTFGAESGTNDDLVSAVMTAILIADRFGAGDPAGIQVGGASSAAAAPEGVFQG